MRVRRLVAVGLMLGLVGGISALEPIQPDQYEQLRKQIKPQPGESRLWEIPWMLDLDEAMQKAAAEGKPIFLWSGAGGPPHTVC